MSERAKQRHTPMTKEEWLRRELAKAPDRSEEWCAEMLKLFGLKKVQ